MTPSITRVLETALYADDLEAATSFYRDVLRLRVMFETPRLVALDAGHASVLLLFQHGSTSSGLQMPEGWIPPHDGTGPVHLAFAISSEEFSAWEQRLEERGVAIESRVQWDSGGRSLYFRDPAGHSVELATPGTWPVY